MLYTGGTTGMPKGVMWRSEDIYFAAMGGATAATRRLDSPEDLARARHARPGRGVVRIGADDARRRAVEPVVAFTTAGTVVLWSGRSFDADAICASPSRST